MCSDLIIFRMPHPPALNGRAGWMLWCVQLWEFLTIQSFSTLSSNPTWWEQVEKKKLLCSESWHQFWSTSNADLRINLKLISRWYCICLVVIPCRISKMKGSSNGPQIKLCSHCPNRIYRSSILRITLLDPNVPGISERNYLNPKVCLQDWDKFLIPKITIQKFWP